MPCDYGISESAAAASASSTAASTAASYSTAATYAAYASAAATAAATATQVVAQKRAAAYQAQVAVNNQTVAEANAKNAIAVGDTRADAKQEQTAQMLGAERAGLAASGVELDSGSALRLQEDTSRLGAIDTGTIRNNAAREAYTYRVQAQNFGMAKSQDQDAGTLDAFGSVLSGASSVAGKWDAYKRAGAF